MSLSKVTLGWEQLLTELVNRWGASADDIRMGLFTGATSPASGDTFATYTAVEASFTGYARQALTWGSVTSPGASQAQVVSNPATFQRTATGTTVTCTGYFVYLAGDSNQLLGAERFASALAVTNSGDSITVTLTALLT